MERDGAFYLGERAGDLRAAIVAGKAAAGLRHAASCLSMIVVVKVAIPLGPGNNVREVREETTLYNGLWTV